VELPISHPKPITKEEFERKEPLEWEESMGSAQKKKEEI